MLAYLLLASVVSMQWKLLSYCQENIVCLSQSFIIDSFAEVSPFGYLTSLWGLLKKTNCEKWVFCFEKER